MAFKQHWAASFANNKVAYGNATQTVYFRAVGATPVPGKWYTTHQGVWLSAGAGYGPQVEFPSESQADEFVKTHSGAFRSSGTTAPRVNVTDESMFVAAFEAAKGKAAVKSEPVAMVDATVDEDAEIAKLKAAIAAKKAAKASKAAEIARLKAELAALDED